MDELRERIKGYFNNATDHVAIDTLTESDLLLLESVEPVERPETLRKMMHEYLGVEYDGPESPENN